MLNDTTNNYLKACETWRQKILGMHIPELLDKLPELQCEEDYLTVKLFAKKFGMDLKTGVIVNLDDFSPAEIISQLNIYTFLWFSSPQARCTDLWVPFRELSGASPFAMAFEKNVLEPLAMTFSGQTEALSQAYETLGGTPLSHSDAGGLVKSFDSIPLKFLFWDGDDEFPAQANILYDRSATDFIHVESTVSLAMEGIERLAAVAGVAIKGPLFKM
jgi:hypothetical protein